MWTLLIFFLLGIVAGIFFKNRSSMGYLIHKIAFITICVLLFLMGYLVGSKQNLLRQLPVLGLKAFILGAGAALGSIIFTWLIFHRKAGKGE